MPKNVEMQATNTATVTGTLLDVSVREMETKADKKPFRSANVVLRVTQTYGGKTEISEIPISMVAMKFKKDGTINSAYENIGALKTDYRSAQQVGDVGASRLRFSGRSVNLRENMFADSRDPENVVSTWQINATFFNEVRGSDTNVTNADCATFSVDIYIMAMSREMTVEGEETGRLKIRGGVVQYGRKLDCFDFYVEDPTAVDYIERNWSINDTVNAMGRIRYTSETVTYESQNTWGEAIPRTSTRTKRELIITQGSDFALDDEKSYSPDDIRALNADRNQRKEQIKIDARNKKQKKAAAAVPSTSYEWEE